MKASKLTLIAAMALGSMLTLGTALAADTNAPATPPAGERPPGGMRRGGPNIEQLAKDLNLNDDQKAKVKDALEAQGKKMRELRQDQNLSQEDRRAKMKEMREDLNKQMKTILTDEQYAKWEKMGPGNRGPRRGPNGAGGPPQN
ncbi:MAG TPA: hypothetical protein VFV23_01665 [Verrucomicrobiae bacterium]|nr:hypothetical protein [Verrucomicrobiae bacterium]